MVKTENEALKEKVDVLFKLGRSYINNTKRNPNESSEREDQTNNADVVDSIQVIEEVDNTIEDLQAWTKMKMRGFKRVNPSASPGPPSAPTAPQSSARATASTARPSLSPNNTSGSASTRPRGATVSTTPPGAPPSPQALPETSVGSGSSEEDNYYRGKYCHYFVNKGSCRYEERTGEKCKFEHSNAPMCNFGTSCVRAKCMFSHPKVNGNGAFLGNMRNFNQMTNPWQMPNPWMSPQPNQFQSAPWAYQANMNHQ